MEDEYLFKIIEKLSKKLPKFDDGRVNYSKSKIAPIINVFIKYKDKILLLKRSDKVLAYKEKWNSLGGFLDELKSIKEKVLEELREELKINKNLIKSIKLAKPYKLFDKSIRRTWLIFPALVELNKMPKIKLDWEHTDFKWIYPEDIKKFDVVLKLDVSLNKVLK